MAFAIASEVILLRPFALDREKGHVSGTHPIPHIDEESGMTAHHPRDRADPQVRRRSRP